MLSKLSGWAYNRDKNAFCINFWQNYRASTVLAIGMYVCMYVPDANPRICLVARVFATAKDSPEVLSFLRLVGCTYYNRHISAFEQRLQKHFSTFESTSSLEQQKQWLQAIRRVIWPRVKAESQTMPSTESLCLTGGDANG